MTCTTHGPQTTSFCIPCYAAQTIRESAAKADTELDYDLVGKYNRPSDSHLDDHTVMALWFG